MGEPDAVSGLERRAALKQCKRCNARKSIDDFVSTEGIQNPRGHYCRTCYLAGEEENRLAALKREAAQVPNLKIIYGEWWKHYAWPDMFRATLYDERKTCPYCDAALPPMYISKKQQAEGRQQRAHIDHMDPLELGGEDSIRNAVFVCERCNTRKGRLAFIDWLAVLPTELRDRARLIYIEKHGHPPEQFSPGGPQGRDTGEPFEASLPEADLKEMYPTPIVDGPPSNKPVVIEIDVDSLLQRPENKERWENLLDKLSKAKPRG
jgi:hypothetical protein